MMLRGIEAPTSGKVPYFNLPKSGLYLLLKFSLSSLKGTCRRS
jgi:hypothetical protein